MSKRPGRQIGSSLGFILLGVGALFLLTELLGVRLAHVTWPLFVIAGLPR